MEKDTVQKRDTRQRRIVLDAVMERSDHPSAEDIYVSVHEKDPKISKGTVYRNLNILSSSGEITKLKTPGYERYDSRQENHCHVMCINCGKVIDAPVEYSYKLDSEVCSHTDFVISRHRTVFEGICGDCRAANIGENKK